MIDINDIQKAVLLTHAGKFDEAEQIYLNLLDNNPDDYILLSTLGLFYINIKNYDKAVELLTKAYNLKKTLGTVSAIGFAEYERNKWDRAVIYLEEALQYGENVDIYNKLIYSLFETRQYKKAIKYSEEMYSKYPKDQNAVANMVKSLTQSGKMAEAEKMCVDYLKENEKAAVLWIELGFLKELLYCNDKQAKECFKIAESLGAVEAIYNIAVSCQRQGEKKEAEKYYKKMLKYFPDNISAITSLGMLYLSEKKFKEGYKYFYKRYKAKFIKPEQNFWAPGKEIEDEVVIICEQGYGDHIQFIRYLPLIPAKKISVAVPNTLKELFRNNYPQCEFINFDKINTKTQAIRITDLAYALDMDFENIPYSEGYLNIEPAIIKSDKPKIGLCWEAGAAGIRGMINRTINVKCFEPIFNLENIQLYSFQYDDTFKGNEKYPQMINLAKDFSDFSDTAKALKAMDAVITVDTAVAHLAGALGVKTFLLLPYVTDWRWFDDTKTTPWYKSVEIFKQTEPITWEKPINNIVSKLRNEH